MISVAIVEDDEVIRESIRNFLNNQTNISCDVAEESVETFLKGFKDRATPDVVLMDIGLPGMSGINGIRLINEIDPDIDILMLTVHNDTENIFQALCAGATGYLLKNTQFPKIREAIEEVHAGGAPMSSEIARKVAAYFHPDESRAHPSPLTPREKEIVIGLVDGLSYKMIAARLDISFETVRVHSKNIYKKLHAHSKGEVISKSLRGQI